LIGWNGRGDRRSDGTVKVADERAKMTARSRGDGKNHRSDGKKGEIDGKKGQGDG